MQGNVILFPSPYLARTEQFCVNLVLVLFLKLSLLNCMDSYFFSYSRSQFEEITQIVLDYARKLGATDAAAEVSESAGLDVAVRQGRVETIEHNKDKGLGITVFIGQCRGHASTSDFSVSSLKATVQAAYNIARFTAKDECAGLPDTEFLETNPLDLKLFHPWYLETEQAIQIARETEQAALGVSALINNSDGASVSAQHAHFILATTQGFRAGYPYSRHTISCAPIAGQNGEMQRDYWYSSKRSQQALAHPVDIGRYAAQRTLSRLGARNLSTRKCPVLFEAPIAAGLLGSFVQAVSGGALYRKSTFLLDCLGRKVFPEHISILENPHCPGEIGSAPFDEEGVRTTYREVVDQGVVQGYFLSSYTARKLGMITTGNAGGSHHLSLRSSLTDKSDLLPALLKKMGTGLLVTELIGHGINYVTGDYSRGASGYWVEAGEIVYPVQGITIAGNLKDLFKMIVAVGADSLIRGAKETGSILIEEMTIAGN